MSGRQYVSQLSKRWGLKAPKQFLRMLRLHMTPFEELLDNIFEALESFNARFAFPTVAAIATMRPELVRRIHQEGHEVASHGYVHVRYPHISKRERENDLLRSIQTFRGLGIGVDGFRAPYDNYTDDMPELLEKMPLVWDGGYGYRPEFREKSDFFHISMNGRLSRITYIPLNRWSDDYMIDTLALRAKQVSKVLKNEVSKIAEKKGVIMFDLHPIRIGQDNYVQCLEELVEYAQAKGGWCPTPAEAISYRKKHNRWRSDSEFCLLLTGDIDNWVFADYLRRQIWRKQTKIADL